MPKSPSVIRLGIFAAAALALYVALAVGVGMSVGYWAGRDDNLARARDQARHALAPTVPAGWRQDPQTRGHVTALETWNGALFASGPGLGVARVGPDGLWEEFNAGLEPGTGVRDLASGSAGFFALDDRGGIRLFEDGRWTRAFSSPPGDARRLGLRGRALDVATADGAYLMDLETGRGQRSPTTWLPAGAARSVDRAVALWWQPLGVARVVVSKPGADGAFDPPADTPGEAGFEILVDGSLRGPERRLRVPVWDANLDETSSPFVRVVAAVDEIGVVDARISESGVESWTELRKGLPLVSVTAVAIWNGDIYVGTRSRGVFRYHADRARFEPFNQGLLQAGADSGSGF